jgi:hypothetical protein
MAKRVAPLALALVAVLVAAVALQPAAFTVERSTSISAPADAIYPHIASLRAMNEWSPFAKMDPKLVTQYEGPESGVGASSSWEGPQMGKGRLRITGASPPGRLEMELEMLAPMAGTNQITFLLEPAQGGTQVTWRMQGRNGFIGKAMTMVGAMDGMVGKPFEDGLQALARLVEGA